ncbi:WD domain, G-beta repeat [Popillia japonica]|uniref:WD domain, G-beta repeat n=1 Tax=Popillia japonica TaxID=7064 RepID=A0AAW1ISW8_POPJA
MSASLKLKQTFDVISKYGAFYTGGNVEWLNNNLFCQTNSVINVVDIETGSVTSTIGDDAENNIDNIQTFTKNDENVVTSHKSGLLKLWNHKGQLVKQWKYIHKGPIAKLQLGNNILISGGSDSTIRCWDLEHQVCLFCLKGLEGVVSIVEFHPVERWIFGSGDNGNINMWEIEKGKLLKVFSGHYSKVTSLCFHHDNKHFITSSRDKVLILWNIENQSAIKTVPVYEVIESVVSLPKKIELPHISIAHDSIHIATAGNKGVIRIWDIANCKEIYVQGNSLINKCNTEGGLAITKLLFNVELEAFAVLSQEHTIVIHDLKTFKCVKQFVGFSDEILDAVYVGKDDSYLAVATNSADIKLYEDSTMNCKLLKGHTDIVLALSKCPDKPILMLSSSKDNSIRLWLMDEGNVQCVGIGLRHTGSVGSVAFGQSSFLVSVSQDMCIKKWELPSKFKENCNLFFSIGISRYVH